MNKYIVGGVIGVVVIGGIAGYTLWGGSNSKLQIVAVAYGNVTEEVQITGTVKAKHDVDLSFERSGRVVSVKKDVGDIVEAGSIIAALDSIDAELRLKQAQATQISDQASYDEALRGTRLEEISIYQAKVDSADSALADAVNQLGDRLRESYTKVDDAVRNKVDQFFNNASSQSPELTFTVNDQQLQIDIINHRKQMNSLLTGLSVVSATTWDSASQVLTDSSSVKSKLTQVSSFLDEVARAVNGLVPTATLTSTTIDGYKSDVLTARTNINTLMTNVLTAEEKVRTSRSSLLVAEQDLSLAKAGSTPEALEAARAKVLKSEAAVLQIQEEINQSYLRSPIAGTVTKQDAKVGAVATMNTPIAAVMTVGNYEIEGYVPEVDIGRVMLADKVDIDFDAFPGSKLTGVVSYIDPAETMIDGVANFKIKIAFDQTDERLKSGLTANLHIKTTELMNVLTLPQYAVVKTTEETYVVVNKNGTPTKLDVVLGEQGDNGLVQIVSGIEEETVVYADPQTALNGQ